MERSRERAEQLRARAPTFQLKQNDLVDFRIFDAVMGRRCTPRPRSVIDYDVLRDDKEGVRIRRCAALIVAAVVLAARSLPPDMSHGEIVLVYAPALQQDAASAGRAALLEEIRGKIARRIEVSKIPAS